MSFILQLYILSICWKRTNLAAENNSPNLMCVFTFTLTHLHGMADIPLMEDYCFVAFQILEGVEYYLRNSKDREGRQVSEQCTWRDGSLLLSGIQNLHSLFHWVLKPVRVCFPLRNGTMHLLFFLKLKLANSRNFITVAFQLIHMAWGRSESNKSSIAVPSKNILLHFKVLGLFDVQN